MRSTLIRLPRRLRQDVAVGLVAAAVFSGLAACHAGGTRSSAHGSASTAGALDGKVPSNVEICNLLPAGEFEERAGAQVERFELSHAPHDTYPSLLCTIDYDRAVQSDFDFLSVRYGKASHDGSSSLEQEVSQSSGNSKIRVRTRPFGSFRMEGGWVCCCRYGVRSVVIRLRIRESFSSGLWAVSP